MEITDELVEEIKRAVRVKSPDADGEIKVLAQACFSEMRIAGVNITNPQDPLAKQAVILYCKGHYGYDDKPEGFLVAYGALRDAMALSSEYREGKSDAGDADNTNS